MGTRPFNFAIFTIALLATFAGSKALRAEDGPLKRYTDIATFLEANPRTSFEELVLKLDPEIRKRFQLVYESRSPNLSTLERPRIILTNEDASLILGIPGSADVKRGNVLEIIETSPVNGELGFREITFASGGVKIDPAPKLCMNCHGNPGSEFKKVAMRPIWDGYPDWPGIYGSSHNDARFYKTSKYGNGSFPKLEFEENALAALKKEMPTLPRYSALIGIEGITTSKLSHVATMFTEALLRRNIGGLIGAFEETVYATYLADPSGYARLRADLMDAIDQGKINSEKVSELKTLLEKEIEKAHATEVEKKSARLLGLVEKFGTPEDRRLLEFGWKIPGGTWTGKLGVAKGSVYDVLPLAIAGVDPRTLATTRGLAVTGLGTPYVGNIGKVWKDGLRSILRDPARPTVGKFSCKITVSPVDIPSPDDVSTRWIEWLKDEGLLF